MAIYFNIKKILTFVKLKLYYIINPINKKLLRKEWAFYLVSDQVSWCLWVHLMVYSVHVHWHKHCWCHSAFHTADASLESVPYFWLVELSQKCLQTKVCETLCTKGWVKVFRQGQNLKPLCLWQGWGNVTGLRQEQLWVLLELLEGYKFNI